MAEAEDFSHLPLTDRWVHKNWKVRKEAYEKGKEVFSNATSASDPEVKDFTNDATLWNKAVADSNVAAQQEGLAALCAFLEIAGPLGCTRTRHLTIVPIIEKGLTGRPDAKKSALEALMLYIELDKADPVIEEMLPLLSHKQPKIIAATFEALTAILHAYGCRTIEPKPLLKSLPKAYGHADKNVRAQAQGLTVEFYRWLKDAMKPLFWDDLKPVQQSDLEKLFEKEKDQPAPKQERFLRSQQAAAERKKDTDGDADGDAEAPGEDGDEDVDVDLEPEHVAVDPFNSKDAQIPDDLDAKVSSKNWKERKEVLEAVLAAVSFPLLQDGPYDGIVRSCAGCMKDANIQVVMTAANCITAIANGLRRPFAKYRSTILSPMLERFKEKKQTVTDALAAACDGVFSAAGLSDILEETLEFLKHKNPSVKQHATEFIKRCLKTTKQAPSIPEVESIVAAVKPVLSDSLEVTRNAAAEALGVLWKIMGDRVMGKHVESLDDIRKAKIKEFCDQAEVKAKWKPAAAPPAKAATATAPGGSRPGAGRRPAPGVRKAAPAPAPRATSPFDENPGHMPISRPTKPVSKLTGPKGGLQASVTPSLKKPGLARPASMASPRRPAAAPAPAEETQTIAPPRGLPAPSRGLAGRSLAKPNTGVPESAFNTPAPTSATGNTAISYADQAELADLRAEADMLRQQNADLRADKMRLQSELHEMQDKHAQLIEDNTRITLSNKTKESQLMRSRFDVEEAEERANNLTRELDRMKREVQRLEREGAAAESDAHDNARSGRLDGGSLLGRPAYGMGKTLLSTGARSKVASPADGDDGKENYGDSRLNASVQRSGGGSNGNGEHEESAPSTSARGLTAPHLHRPVTTSNGPMSGHASSLSSTGSRNSSLNRSQTEGGVESWKRAAEVTQNLKARIELMKKKQQAGR